MRVGCCLLLLAGPWIGPAAAEEPASQRGWERVSVPAAETAVVAVAADPAQPARIVAATPHVVMESMDEGATWIERFRTPQAARVVGVAVEPGGRGTILVATERGLYGSLDGARWGQWFRGIGQAQRCTRVVFHPLRPGLALLGTQDGLFVSRDRGRHWEALLLPFSARRIYDAAFAPDESDSIYVVAADGLYVGRAGREEWERRLGSAHAEEPGVEGPEVVDIQTAEEPGSLHRLSALATDPQDPAALYLASDRGLQVSRDRGLSWEPMAHPGQLGPFVQLLLQRRSPMVLYAATPHGVARYDANEGAWSAWAQESLGGRVHALAASPRYLWAATDEGLARLELGPEPFAAQELPTPRELLANFSHEPTMADVRQAAIRYAEVHPDKLKRWRRQAALQALLPKFDVGYDMNRSRDTHFDEGTFPRFQLVETQDRDHRVDFSVNWDLGELLWNDQTAIDTRSKLLVELRRDIVEEITRLYFERRKLQVGLLISPPPAQEALIEQELRVQELTARLDGLTGGYFSQHTWDGTSHKEGAWTP